ncbi:MAG: hypothetical protein L6Q99_08315 [Planctomycetes bacterium]|nr:hypothetical protein [Planctomycetota bacterium]
MQRRTRIACFDTPSHLALGALCALAAACAQSPLRDSAGGVPAALAATATATREFEVRDDRAWLGGEPVELWGLRCGNALANWTVTERHVRALDHCVAHGINTLGVYIQGSNGGWPDADAGVNGYGRDGRLKPDVAERLEWLVREADRRGMVVMVGLFSPRKDQELEGEPAIRRAIEETARFLVERNLRNVFVDLMHEFDHTERADQPLLREPDGAAKKAELARWFHAVAPTIEVGVCPYENSPTTDTFPGMDVRIIQKSMAIPSDGFVVNVETQKQDAYENDGVFGQGQIDAILADCERYLASPNAVMLFHAAFIQGIGNFSGTGPHAEMGGYGTTTGDRGVRFYYEWVRDHVGVWRYPRHEPYVAPPRVDELVATREFELRDSLPYLGGEPVKLWGVRVNNALLSPATTERLIANLDTYAEHGVNLLSVALQGTNGGFPDVDAGPNAFTPDGRLIGGFKKRLEAVVRAADARGMVVCVGVMMPRKDQLLTDEAAVRNAVEETARFLEERKLRNVLVNLFQEFHHPSRIDHAIFREPDGDTKKQRLTQWFKAFAPSIEVGICPNHLNGSPPEYTGCDVIMIHEDMPLPDHGFVLNTETPDEDQSGAEGIFNAYQRKHMESVWTRFTGSARLAMLFRSPYLEDVRGRQGTGPNFELGGAGKGEASRGVRPYFEWLKANVGAWRYPRHVK